MPTCKRCQLELTVSQYIHNGKFKSCPNCSRILGYHAYYPIEYFGERHHADGTPFIQSYCPVCRGNSGRIGTPVLTC